MTDAAASAPAASAPAASAPAASAPAVSAPSIGAPRRGARATLAELGRSAWGTPIALFTSLAEASFVPWLPAEAVLAPLAWAAPDRARRLGAIALAGALLGVLACWGVGAALPPIVRRDAVSLFPGVGNAETVRSAVGRRGGGAAALALPIVGEPAGAYALEAGVRGASLLALLASTGAARGARLALVLGAAAYLGRRRPW